MFLNQSNKDQDTAADRFWAETVPDEHVLQLYESDNALIDTLTAFVLAGVKNNESCIIIATDEHSRALEARLERQGLDMISLLSEHRYIPLNAKKTLSKFMVNGWPEESLFRKTIGEVLLKARGPKQRSIRAFGEMVAILWADGHKGATLHLEALWNSINEKEKFLLFCAYPATGFTEDLAGSVKNICCAHTKTLEAALPG